MQVSFSPQELVHFTSHFGTVEQNPGVPPQYLMPDLPEVQVIGNVRDVNGQLRAMFAKEVPLSKEHGIRYDPARRTPVSRAALKDRESSNDVAKAHS